MSDKKEPSTAAQIAAELQRNRELTIKLYMARGEVPPDDAASDHSMCQEPGAGTRRPWEVYASMPGIDSLYSGLSKRTLSGGFFTS